MRQIQLNQNQIVILDDEDYDRLSTYHWCYRAERDGAQGYAIRHVKVDGKNKSEYMHRAIMNPPPGYTVIFKNYDRLDCRRENLCVVTTKESRRHHRVRSDSKTGIKGVRFNPDGGTWTAMTYRNGNCYTIGNFYTQEEARQAYEAELQRENAELYSAPAVVERQAEPARTDEMPTNSLA